jgi:hypothetical protein
MCDLASIAWHHHDANKMWNDIHQKEEIIQHLPIKFMYKQYTKSVHIGTPLFSPHLYIYKVE